jgi:5-methylcytosine-specific restriction endonuclease McrA
MRSAERGNYDDHIVPISKGDTSDTADNIQLLCARHNLVKGALEFQGFTARLQ